ncbi:AMP-binding protein [Agrobacterium tumefaciens]|nr:AMP-binding protein [Agrobacterium tumefaciens]NTE68219.1 AMP-binding protein [Agrobacterium tumefaciens]
MPHQGPTDATLALRALAAFPDRVAFRWTDGQMLYREAASLIARLQVVLTREGIVPGTIVALLSSNRPEAWCSVIAIQSLGGAVCNLHPMGTMTDQVQQIEALAPSIVIVDRRINSERARQLAQACPSTRHFILGGPPEPDPDATNDLVSLARLEDAEHPVDQSLPDLPATLNFTGGTTGRPRPVSRSAGGLAQMSLTILSDFQLPAEPRYLAVAPISHVAGTKIVPVLLRGGMIYLVHGFDPPTIFKVIDKERINMTLLVPTMIYSLLDCLETTNADLSSLELLLYGAAPMATARLEQGLRKIGPVFAQLYGQTECYPVAVLRREDHDPAHPERLASCGFPVATANVSLLKPDGTRAATGERGEICVRAPMVMSEYRGQPEDTRHALKDGWLHTGDIAYQDATGRLFIVDRLKDMIVTGGFNVYPKEIEEILTRDPGVAAAAVIGVPDEKWGEAVVAYVVAKEGADIAPQVLLEIIKTEKGSVYTPKRLEVVSKLPLTALGKIDKKQIRAHFWEGQHRKV